MCQNPFLSLCLWSEGFALIESLDLAVSSPTWESRRIKVTHDRLLTADQARELPFLVENTEAHISWSFL